jgi:hypothetical protein
MNDISEKIEVPTGLMKHKDEPHLVSTRPSFIASGYYPIVLPSLPDVVLLDGQGEVASRAGTRSGTGYILMERLTLSDERRLERSNGIPSG